MDNPSQFVIYQSEDGQTKLDVRFVDETVWLTQALMAELFSTSKQNIGQHLKNIFSEQELTESSVVKDFFTTAKEVLPVQMLSNLDVKLKKPLRLALG